MYQETIDEGVSKNTGLKLKIVTIYVCPKCDKPDDGTMVVQRKSCEDWFHEYCVENCNIEEDWY